MPFLTPQELEKCYFSNKKAIERYFFKNCGESCLSEGKLYFGLNTSGKKVVWNLCSDCFVIYITKKLFIDTRELNTQEIFYLNLIKND